MSEVFTQVETAEDEICEIMQLFCDVQDEICTEVIKQKDELFDDELTLNAMGDKSVTERSS